MRGGKGHITCFYREEGFANGEGWTESMKEYDGISHSPTSLSVWALGFVKSLCEESSEEKSQKTVHNAGWVYATKSFKELERWRRGRALFGPSWSANTPRNCKLQSASHSGGQPSLSANMVSAISGWNQSTEWEKERGGWPQACFCPKAQSWSHGDILAGICTLPPRGVVFPEEGNGDTAAMPTWAARALPQPLKLLWKHDTGRAALLSSLIQSLTNGTKVGGGKRWPLQEASQGLLLQQ